MKFEGIEIYGFKSFADRVTIDFQNGLTGIVGPNGCGKSNVVDAITWVLGEQSAKILRGKTMQDVIFNGTARRKSLSFCEVDLKFNNEGPNRIFKNLEFDKLLSLRENRKFSWQSRKCVNLDYVVTAFLVMTVIFYALPLPSP